MSRWGIAGVMGLALALAACGSTGTNGNQSGGAQAGACKFGGQRSDLNDLLKQIETQSMSPDQERAWVRANEARLRNLAQSADTVTDSSLLGEIACRRISTVAYTTLMSVAEFREAARTDRRNVSEKGQNACGRLSAADRQEGSAGACKLFDLYLGAYGAGLEMDRVLRTTTNAPVTVALLNQTRMSTDAFTQSVKADWARIPVDGAFAEIGKKEKTNVACAMALRVNRMLQATGPDGVTAAANALSGPLSELEDAVAASLGVSRQTFVRDCGREP